MVMTELINTGFYYSKLNFYFHFYSSSHVNSSTCGRELTIKTSSDKKSHRGNRMGEGPLPSPCSLCCISAFIFCVPWSASNRHGIWPLNDLARTSKKCLLKKKKCKMQQYISFISHFLATQNHQDSWCLYNDHVHYKQTPKVIWSKLQAVKNVC